jgi:hypothetical protein
MWFILTDIQDIHSLTTTFVYCQFMSTWLKYWACVTHLSFCFEETYYRTFHRCFPPIFGSFCYAVSEKKIFRNWLIWKRIACGGHVCLRIGTKWAIAIEDLSMMLPTMFWFIWLSGLRGVDFLEINQSEIRISCGGHVC